MCLPFRKILLSIMYAILCFSLTGVCHANEAAKTVEKIGIAIDMADAQAFQELVDMDGVLGNALAVFVAEAKKPENAPLIPPMLALLLPQLAGENSAASSIRGLLLGEMKSFVLSGIASGSFAGKRPDPAKSSGMLAPLFANASMGRKEIAHIGSPRRDGQDWLVPFSVHDYGNEQDYLVVGRLSPADNGMRLTNIENLGHLMAQIAREEQ